ATPEKLDIDAELSGRELSAGMYSFASLRAKARGPLMQPHVEAHLRDEVGPNVDAHAHLSAGRTARVSGLTVRVSRGEAALAATVGRVEIGKGAVALQKVRVTGVGGETTGDATIASR